MAFKTFVAGEVLTAANVNDYLMEQAVIVCTSGTRPSSPQEGMTIYETDTDRQLTWDGSAWVIALEYGVWTDYSGSFTWGATGTAPAIGNGTVTARYRRSGKLVYYSFRILMGSTTTYGTGTYTFSVPVSIVGSRLYIGSAYLRDTSAAANGHVPGIVIADGANPTFVVMTSSAGAGTGTVVGVTTPFTWANTDHMTGTVIYESA